MWFGGGTPEIMALNKVSHEGKRWYLHRDHRSMNSRFLALKTASASCHKVDANRQALCIAKAANSESPVRMPKFLCHDWNVFKVVTFIFQPIKSFIFDFPTTAGAGYQFFNVWSIGDNISYKTMNWSQWRTLREKYRKSRQANVTHWILRIWWPLRLSAASSATARRHIV